MNLLEISIWEKINNDVAFLANWLGLLGFVVTVITAIKVFFLNSQVRRLNARHLFSERVNDHVKDLKNTSGQLASQIGNCRKNIGLIRTEIYNCLVNCYSLKKKVTKSDLPSLWVVIKKSKRIIKNKHDDNSTLTFADKILQRRPILERDIDDYYRCLSVLITEINHLVRDNKKSII